MSRLPNINEDDGVWGNILCDYLLQSLKDDGTIKNLDQTLNFTDANGTIRAAAGTVSGDFWLMCNAYWDPVQQNFYRTDVNHTAFGLQMQGVGYIPGEPDLGFIVSGAIQWVAQGLGYSLIRGGGTPTGLVFGAVGGWELGMVITQERQLTIGGGGIEIDGYGTIPYGRVVNNTTGTALAKRLVGMMQNAYTDFGGYDDPAQESWYWGYVESYNPAGGGPPYPVVPGTSHWAVAYQPAHTTPGTNIWNEWLTIKPDGEVLVSANPTAALGVATKQYVDAATAGTPSAVGGTTFFTGTGTATQFFHPHGIGHSPSRVMLTPTNQASVGCWVTWDATNFGVNYATPPANGATIGVAWNAFA